MILSGENTKSLMSFTKTDMIELCGKEKNNGNADDALDSAAKIIGYPKLLSPIIFPKSKEGKND